MTFTSIPHKRSLLNSLTLTSLTQGLTKYQIELGNFRALNFTLNMINARIKQLFELVV
jgi:hypothetical protein